MQVETTTHNYLTALLWQDIFLENYGLKSYYHTLTFDFMSNYAKKVLI